jgi:hypothetical protein
MSTLGAELRARPMPTASASWDHATAMAAYRATGQRISAWWDAADVFDKPSLQRPDIQRADRAVQAAFRAHDYGAVVAALARWEQAIMGGRS